MTKILADIEAQLLEPFDVKDVELLPKGSHERDGKIFCMAMPYADPRRYQDRLNKLAPGEWSTPPPIALTVGDKLVCYVTVIICGVPHTDVGEAGPGENQGTEAWAQAFKRACSQFGLGRYLYDLEKAWVPYNKQRKQIDLDSAGIRQVVLKMYMKANIPIPQQSNKDHAESGQGKQEPTEEVPTVGTLRKRVEALKPQSKNGAGELITLSFEQFYWSVTKKTYTSDDAISPEDSTLLSRRLDIIAQTRQSQKAS